MAKQCAICNKTIGTLGVKYTSSDNHKICWKCIRDAGYGVNASFIDIKRESLENIKNHKEKLVEEKNQKENNFNNFVPAVNIENLVEVDTERKLFRLTGLKNILNVFDLSAISSYEVIENGSAISSGGLGRAALGAVTFGGTGAIVGAVTGKKKTKTVIEKLQIKIMLNDLSNPVLYIDLIKKPIKQNSKEYVSAVKRADNVLSSLNTVLSDLDDNSVPSTNAESSFSNPEEIRKYKELMDDGIISQEEFDAKKKELLNL